MCVCVCVFVVTSTFDTYGVLSVCGSKLQGGRGKGEGGRGQGGT